MKKNQPKSKKKKLSRKNKGRKKRKRKKLSNRQPNKKLLFKSLEIKLITLENSIVKKLRKIH
jgi:hypothetical protein